MQSALKARVYLAAGFVFVGLGVAGIPLPLLPTTPFLLAAAYCFARGNKKWHDWLVNHGVLGVYIVAFRERRGLTPGQKLRLAIVITLTLLITAIFAPVWAGKLLAGFIWVTSMIALYLTRTAESKK